MTAAIYLLLGPLFALPRTGSVSFEIGVTPFLLEGTSTFLPMFLYTGIFFALTYFFSLKPTKIIDIVGKVMTPLLLLSILIIFVAAVINPLGEIQQTSVNYANGPFVEGLLRDIWHWMDLLPRYLLLLSSTVSVSAGFPIERKSSVTPLLLV